MRSSSIIALGASDGGISAFDDWIDIREASNLADDLIDERHRYYSTLAGYILPRLGRLPHADEIVTEGATSTSCLRRVADTGAVS